jgi:hypothetical protein
MRRTRKVITAAALVGADAASSGVLLAGQGLGRVEASGVGAVAVGRGCTAPISTTVTSGCTP